MFNISEIKTLPLSKRKNKISLEVMINPDDNPKKSSNKKLISYTAKKITKARQKNASVILFFGAHLIKNGLSLILRKMSEEGYLTHLATNGAGSIHDWEFAYQGETKEDVRYYVKKGQFGLWEETGKYLNSALIEGAKNNFGYGESIGKIIHEGRLQEEILRHQYKEYSIQEVAYSQKIPFTVHPSLGQDIIHTHPSCDFSAIGKTAQIDFYKFVDSVSNLENGVYLSVGSAITSPMVFEKALSIARNVKHQKNKKIKDFLIVVNDIQEGRWNWRSGIEPSEDNPAYYLRFCKTFDRMGARKMYYIKEDNKVFLTNLYHELKRLNKS